MKTSYLYLGSILCSLVGYVFFITNKAKINKLNNHQQKQYSQASNEPINNTPSSVGSTSELMKFKFATQPDFSTWKKFLAICVGFSILLPWILDDMSVANKLMGSVFTAATMSVLFLSIFAAMNCKKVEINEGKIHVYGFFGGNYSLCSSDIIEMKYRARNQILELKERRNDDLNNEYKIKMMSFRIMDVHKILHFCHLIESAKHISMVQAFF
jgi:hypothetical protein